MQPRAHQDLHQTQDGSPVLILITTRTVTVISKTGHHVLASHDIKPDKNYWPNKHKNPGQKPGNL